MPFESYIQDCVNEAPCMLSQIREFARTRPFEGMRVLDATPIYFNSLLKYQAVIAGGGELEVFCNGKFFDYKVVGILQQHGVRVHSGVDGLKDFDVIMDCGAELESVPAAKGRVEMTASGIRRYRERSDYTVDVDSSRLKRYMSYFGTADGLIRALERLGMLKPGSGGRHNAVVFGFGKVGRGVADALSGKNFRVYVVEKPGKIVTEYPCFYSDQRDILFRLVSDSELVVSAAGVYNGAADALGNPDRGFPDGVRFVNMGYERDFAGWRNVLNDGFPLNFILEESTRTCYIDPVLALSNVCGARLATDGTRRFRPSGISENIVLPAESDEAEIEESVKKELRIEGAFRW